MYQAELGRFMTRDPLPQEGVPDVLYDNNEFGRWLDLMKNLYGYTSAGPIDRADPYGLACRPAEPPMNVIPTDDEYVLGTTWVPRRYEGYPLSRTRRKFVGVTCDCCTMDVEIIGRAYRYYRYSASTDKFIGHDGLEIGVSNDPRDFFSLAIFTVCKTNIKCGEETKADSTEFFVSTPLQRQGLGVFIRQGVGDIETTFDNFATEEQCNFAENALAYIQQNVRPGRVDPSRP